MKTVTISLFAIVAIIGHAETRPAEVIYKQCPRTSCPSLDRFFKNMGWVSVEARTSGGKIVIFVIHH